MLSLVLYLSPSRHCERDVTRLKITRLSRASHSVGAGPLLLVSLASSSPHLKQATRHGIYSANVLPYLFTFWDPESPPPLQPERGQHSIPCEPLPLICTKHRLKPFHNTTAAATNGSKHINP